MKLVRLIVVLALLVVAGVLLAGWAVLEARRQQAEIEASLVTEASILARSLGPGLAAASNAVREFDEFVTWKLLDNARLLAELDPSALPRRIMRISEANGLDAVAYVDAKGVVQLHIGEDLVVGLVSALTPILSGPAEEAILGSTVEDDIEHVAVAVRRPGGGAVVVVIHPTSARTFVRRLGVGALLERLVGSGGVLYLSYREDPGSMLAQATWDDGPVPEPPEAGVKVRPVRNRSAFEVGVPVDTPAGGRAELRVGLDGAPLERAAMAATRRSLVVGVALIAFGLVSVGFALVSSLRSQEREEAARRLAEVEEARRRSERLAAAGALTAGLAHEVRSPLNAIGLAAQRLERKHPDGTECAVFARRIQEEVNRLEGALREFLDLARPVAEEREPVAIADVAGEVLELLGAEADERGVLLDRVEGSATVHADREALRRSLINLVRNAVEASPEGGRVGVVVEQASGAAEVRIVDEGSGIDPELTEKVFEAFMTTRASGTGLGLSLVRRVAEEHGGTCGISNRAGGGAVATLRLPVHGKTK